MSLLTYLLPVTQNASRKSSVDKNKELRGGAKFTFLFQGKISALNHKLFPGWYTGLPLKKEEKQKGKGRKGKREGEVAS